MRRTDLPSRTCTVARALAVVGDEWTLMILREMFLGTRRFDAFLRQTGMSSHLLSRRLKKLEAHGVIRREPYSDRPLRYEYRLTDMGRDLWPIIITLKQWGDRWLSDEASPIEIVHTSCGQLTQPHLTCPVCGAAMTARDAVPHLSQHFQHERQHAGRQS
ncbi:helix-turn-helix domain-containing protein [Aestuariivita sp.]|jgi:DNA-binding HxlR family transcriptional regulator|uniref:winged helix-turn-helix transcriptional regulator n=1 Tax=Aestuariivita sp. TaxID=1872407 RepID=UPI0021735940|nr:helix-turn-helix domain-containing protein [Aestuariivita sp.]MCE8009500.1 helix-turn-helix transcriptional regulator [Aestuariivita sp.]